MLLCARLAGASCFVYSSGAFTPPVRYRASTFAALDDTTLAAVGAAAVTLAGGATFLGSQGKLNFGSKDDLPAASAPSPPPPSPLPNPTKPSPTPRGKQWQSRGGSGGPHRMSGTWPKESPRELWWPPAGGGGGYHRMAGRLATQKTVVPSPDAGSTSQGKRKRLGKVLKQVKAGVGGVVGRLFQRKGQWPARGGTSGYHRMAGRLDKREAVTATATVTAAAKTVTSWYDAGTRL